MSNPLWWLCRETLKQGSHLLAIIIISMITVVLIWVEDKILWTSHGIRYTIGTLIEAVTIPGV